MQVSVIQRRKVKYKGMLFYKTPNKIRVEYKFPKGQIIISDGKVMWIYIPYQKIVGYQKLSNNSLTNIPTKPNISFLFSRYSYKFSNEEQPFLSNNRWYYSLVLRDKRIKKNFTYLKLWISKEKFIIEKIEGMMSGDKRILITYSNIEINKDLKDNLFSFKIPKGVYLYNNPLGW
jgi:outer membrane lipoprotein carrier protein